jgi:hypothetical protein
MDPGFSAATSVATGWNLFDRRKFVRIGIGGSAMLQAGHSEGLAVI